ncbi:glycosyltransferase family 4 protein [Lichenihabitans sp. PAMC28606]|uniref:glycosyltransferase family 4 protein n=1 Tax=Lichenihabitans sp. PAMC28606 TaxID=2880932 RepID=UPI001D0B96B8|nr:glycosyltransferase family 4 protein [Lichenihabitans sp. PAMC28606]UDL94796.1 glycosyltransferase family 4 protein [Lichenihabitans sp. PAMC28606]
MSHDLASPFVHAAPSRLAGRTVLQIIPALEAGGAERTTIDIAAALAEAGARSLVATTGGRLVSELQARGGIWVPFPADTKNPIAMARNVLKLRALIRDERPAVVHAQSRAPAWVALGATRMTGTPLMTTYHGSYSGSHAIKLQYNSVMARGDAVIANSHFTAETIARLYPWARDRVRIISPGVDLREFHPDTVHVSRVEALRSAWGVAPDQRVVLLAARLTEWKGQKVLIAAAAKLRDRGVSDLVFILAGDHQGRNRYVADLDTLIADHKLGDLVKRVGHCADMPAALLAASLVIVPSTRPEAFGLSAVEAQAMGTPVVVSNLGAVPETVLAPPEVQPEQRTGWRVPAGDVEALAEAIASALALGATARDTMARRARLHIETEFSLDHMTEAMLDAYSAAIEGHLPARAR